VLVLLQKLLMLMLMPLVQHCVPLVLPFCAAHHRADPQSMSLV